MKVALPNPEILGRRSGFTLIEATMVMGILVLLVGSIIMCNLYGLSMSVRQQIWLSASDDAGHAMGTLMSDIRTGASNYVGNGDLNGFTNVVANVPEVGNALKIYVGTTNGGTNIPWILYYYNTASNMLVRTNYTGSNFGDFRLVSANPITNDNYIFTETDYLGNVLTNAVATPIIQVYLSFTSLQNPQVVIAPGSAIDFYQIVTTIASRNRP
jgi:type II secretory pathway pseudopilin PulG